jgi:hypothetical protein
MDPMLIFAIIEKGITVTSMLINASQNAAPAIEVIKNLVTGAQAGTVTDEVLAAAEATLDAMIDDFNSPLE